jgi:hypothetical protein
MYSVGPGRLQYDPVTLREIVLFDKLCYPSPPTKDLLVAGHVGFDGLSGAIVNLDLTTGTVSSFGPPITSFGNRDIQLAK